MISFGRRWLRLLLIGYAMGLVASMFFLGLYVIVAIGYALPFAAAAAMLAALVEAGLRRLLPARTMDHLVMAAAIGGLSGGGVLLCFVSVHVPIGLALILVGIMVGAFAMVLSRVQASFRSASWWLLFGLGSLVAGMAGALASLLTIATGG